MVLKIMPFSKILIIEQFRKKSTKISELLNKDFVEADPEYWKLN